MRILVYGDLQATEGHERCRSNPSIPLQRKRVSDFFSWACKVAEDEKVDTIIDLGDTTDDRDAVPLPTLKILNDGLSKLLANRTSYKLIGNHEQWDKEGVWDTASMFQRSFTEVFSSSLEPHVHDTGYTVLVFVPFHPDITEVSKRLAAKLEELKNRTVFLFVHHAPVGAVMNSGMSLSGVPREVLKSVTLSFFGHIHKPQEVAKNVIVVGSPFQQDAGEAEEDKRVVIVDTVKSSWKAIKPPAGMFPQYLTMSWEEFQGVKDPGEDRIKVELRDQTEVAAFQAHKNKLWATPVFKFNTVAQASEDPGAVKQWSPATVIERYLSRVPPSSRGISMDDKDMVDFGLDLAGLQR